ncbi:MAG: RICIN domain-containing protein [Lachnospiraceae bacterium]|nr:RICIN domain-containing protein [Lachnospiraceae bacterium]
MIKKMGKRILAVGLASLLMLAPLSVSAAPQGTGAQTEASADSGSRTENDGTGDSSVNDNSDENDGIDDSKEAGGSEANRPNGGADGDSTGGESSDDPVSGDQDSDGDPSDDESEDEDNGSDENDEESDGTEDKDEDEAGTGLVDEDEALLAAPVRTGMTITPDYETQLTGQAPSTGVYRIQVASEPTFALSIDGDSLETRANANIGHFSSTSGQYFYITNCGNGQYTIENILSGCVLDAESAGTAKGTNIRQYKYNGTVAQKWTFKANGNGSYTIGAAYCNRVWDIDTGRIAEGSNVRLWSSNGTKAQQWSLTKVMDPLPTDDYRLNCGGTITVKNDSLDKCANVETTADTALSRGKQFMVRSTNGGMSYTIRNRASAMAFDIENGATTSGTNVRQYKTNGTAAQDWRFVPIGGGRYRVISMKARLFLCVKNGNVLVLDSEGAKNAESIWTLQSVPVNVQVQPGMYRILSAKNSNIGLDVVSGCWLNKTNIQVYTRTTTASQSNQQFELVSTGGDWFRIVNVATGKCLDKTGGAESTDTNVQSYKINGTVAQNWRFEDTGDHDGSYYIVNGLGKYLDIQGGVAQNNTNVQVHKSNKTAAQKWYLEPTSFSGKGWRTTNSTERRFYRDGKYLTGGWQLIGGYYYYFDNNGLMAYSTASKTVNIGNYYVDQEGRRRSRSAADILSGVKPGGKTLTNLMQNALIPCGRVLYIWGGGWGDSDANKIGYLSSWGNFFNSHANGSYNRNDYKYKYGAGLDCSGYISWVVYNTQFTANNQFSILSGNGTSYNSTKLANRIASLGWATYYGGAPGSYRQLKPGDIVSMNGHVWMYVGSCSDGSGVIVHSSPMGQTYGGGVQLAGTVNDAGQANSEGYRLAKAYNEKYFSYWPYPTNTAGNSYRTSAVGYARWNNDPDGLKNMTAAQVLNKLLGPL